MSAKPRTGYSFPALRGRMGQRNYYTLLLPLSVVPRLLPPASNVELPTEARAQRKLNAKRVPEIARYILDNEDDWLFSSLTASFETDEEFEPAGEFDNLGILYLPLDTQLLINDGQHRRAAIETALKEDPTIGDQSISVVLFPGESIERNQQMFSDLNRTVQKTPRSLDIVYDHRDPLNQLTLSVAERVPLLKGKVEKEAVSLAVRSAKLITVSSLYDSLEQLLGTQQQSIHEAELSRLEDSAVRYWDLLSEALASWKEIRDGYLRPAEARGEYMNVHSVFFFAIGGVGRELVKLQRLDLVEHLGSIDFRRTNREWQGICMLGSDIITRRQTRMALRQQLLFKLGVAEPPESVLGGD